MQVTRENLEKRGYPSYGADYVYAPNGKMVVAEKIDEVP